MAGDATRLDTQDRRMHTQRNTASARPPGVLMRRRRRFATLPPPDLPADLPEPPIWPPRPGAREPPRGSAKSAWPGQAAAPPPHCPPAPRCSSSHEVHVGTWSLSAVHELWPVGHATDWLLWSFHAEAAAPALVHA